MRIFMALLLSLNISHGFIFIPLILSALADKDQGPPYKLYIQPTPKNATIKIMNIKPKFEQGIRLSKGKYRINVSAAGYQTAEEWIDLFEHSTYAVKLKPIEIKKSDYIDTKNSVPELKDQEVSDTQPAVPKTCNDGNIQACFNEGLKHHQEYDFLEAVNYYQKGCDGSDGSSCVNLGVMYFYAEGVFEDSKKAKELFEKGCKLGNDEGCQNLSSLKQRGL